jgi:tape measure domain-containing protein
LLAAGFAGRELIQAADGVSLVEARIRLYSDSAREAEQITAQLFEVSRSVGTSFNGLAETYARLAPAQDRLGLSSNDLLGISEAIGAAFRVSGASAQEATNATIQLSQAFASGELRGEELRSVMEQGQRIMIALGNQTGKTTGELRAMAEAGQLTADVVADALLAELPKLRDEISQLPDTAAVGFERLRSSFVQLVSNINQATGATEMLSRAMTGIGEDIAQINQRFSSEFSDQIEVTERDISSLENEITRLDMVLANPAASGVRAGELANIRSRAEAARLELERLRVQEESLRIAQANAAEVSRRAAAYTAIYGGIAEETAARVEPLNDEVLTLANNLERQRIMMAQGAEAAALYQAAIAKGSELTAAETQLIRENVRALEAATAAREDDERAQQRQQQMLSARLRNFMEIQRVQREMREEQEREAVRNREGAERDFGGMVTRDRAENPLLQLEDEYSQRLAIIREARENEIIAEEEYERRRLEMTRRYSAERNQIMLASASAGFGSLAQIIGAAAGETSAAYKVLFGISKGFAIAESVIAIQQAIAKALAVGFPANIPLMAQAAAAGASIINTITSTQPGFADGGYVSGSGTGRSDSISARLSNGEFVVNSAATKSNRGLLEAINSGSSVGVKQSGGVQIYNYAPGVKHEAQIMDDGRIRVIAREEAAKVAPDAAAGALKDPNSRLSKSMTQNVNAPRRRL